MLIVTVILFFSHRFINLKPFTFFFVNERPFELKLHLHYFVQRDKHCIQGILYIKSNHAFPGNLTQYLGVASIIVYCLSYRKAFAHCFWYKISVDGLMICRVQGFVGCRAKLSEGKFSYFLSWRQFIKTLSANKT